MLIVNQWLIIHYIKPCASCPFPHQVYIVLDTKMAFRAICCCFLSDLDRKLVLYGIMNIVIWALGNYCPPCPKTTLSPTLSRAHSGHLWSWNQVKLLGLQSGENQKKKRLPGYQEYVVVLKEETN